RQPLRGDCLYEQRLGRRGGIRLGAKMATSQRPTKEGSVRTYQEKVGLGFVDILASEMDADLDTIYAAWNGGVDSATLKALAVTTPKIADGAVTPAKLGAPAPYLPLAGGVLSGRLIVGAPGGDHVNYDAT